METRKPAVNPVCRRRRRVGWEPASPAPARPPPRVAGPPRPPPPGSWSPRGLVPEQRQGSADAGSSGLPGANSPVPVWPNLGRPPRRGSWTPGRPPGDRRAGPRGRTSRAAAHTVPGRGVSAQPTRFRNIEAPSPGRGGREGLIQPPPSLMPACVQGGDKGGQTRSHPHPPPPVPHSQGGCGRGQRRLRIGTHVGCVF